MTDTEDLAPDANEPGDTTLHPDLRDLIHTGDVIPDNVDKAEVEDE